MKTKFLLGTLIVVLTAAGGVLWWHLDPLGKRNEQLHLFGVVEIQEVRLGSKIGGRVSHVYVREGEQVHAGQVLVRFEMPEMEAIREQVSARLAMHEAELEKAVKGPREEEVRQARSEQEASDADLQLAKEEFQRVDRLSRQGGSTRAEMDVARAARDRAHGRFAAAKAKLDLMLAGTRPEEIAECEAKVAEVRGRLREIESHLNEAEVKAPDDAVVEVVAVRKGDLVAPNQTIIRILRRDDLWVRVYVPVTDLGKVYAGQRATILIDSFPLRRFEGRVAQIASVAEFTPRNVQSVDERRHQVFAVRIQVPQPEDPKDRIFRSGMAAEVFLPAQRNLDAVRDPEGIPE